MLLMMFLRTLIFFVAEFHSSNIIPNITAIEED